MLERQVRKKSIQHPGQDLNPAPRFVVSRATARVTATPHNNMMELKIYNGRKFLERDALEFVKSASRSVQMVKLQFAEAASKAAFENLDK